MIHLDLFSGIGGFSYAVDEVWGKEKVTHIFCDNDTYCQAVLRKHWPNSEHWSDIRELIAHARGEKPRGLSSIKWQEISETGKSIDVLTGGFPCQPFSTAGKRRGKGDDRYLWPEMLECIRLFRPTWVIAENVYGILNIQGGLVFEQVCSDMEKEGYEVWSFIIPACAVNAPHRRDRVWFVGYNKHGKREKVGKVQAENANSPRSNGDAPDTSDKRDRPIRENGSGNEGCQRLKTEKDVSSRKEIPLAENIEKDCSDAPNAISNGCEGRHKKARGEVGEGEQGGMCKSSGTNSISSNPEHDGFFGTNGKRKKAKPPKQTEQECIRKFERGGWLQDWKQVAAATCIRGVDDGIPRFMDGVRISQAKQRTERLKMLGNSIVPEDVIEIMKAIKYIGGDK